MTLAIQTLGSIVVLIVAALALAVMIFLAYVHLDDWRRRRMIDKKWGRKR